MEIARMRLMMSEVRSGDAVDDPGTGQTSNFSGAAAAAVGDSVRRISAGPT
jgi:hypothetical protein